MISTGDQSPIPIVTWVAIAGRWMFDTGGIARYERPMDAQLPYGLALGNERFRGGRVSFTVRFETSTGIDASGGIAIGYSALDSSYLQVALGGFNHAYSISEYLPGAGWRAIAGVGSVENLEANRDYHCTVSQIGQRIVLEVERVRVLEKILSGPISGDQLGLFAFGRQIVSFRDVSIEPYRPRVFVAMQFSEPFDTFYEHVIRPVAQEQEFGFDVVRIDEKAGPGIIFQEIKNEIEDASMVVAEITAPNENVFYELGYAHALNKPTILLAQRGKQLPFDIRSYRVIFYDDTIGGKNAVEDQLRNHFRAIARDS